MGVDAIHTRGEFKITKNNINKYEDDFPEGDESLVEDIENLGWCVTYSRKSGITKINRECEGWVRMEEYEFFKKLAPYVKDGSYIEFEIIYGGASYEKWSFEEGLLIVYQGHQTIEWVEDEDPGHLYR